MEADPASGPHVAEWSDQILCFLFKGPERGTSECQRVLGDSADKAQKRIPCSADAVLGSTLKCEMILNSMPKLKN